jgi:hypothetical protein
MTEIDPELDGRLALLREAAEPTGADKQRLLVALRTSIHTNAASPSQPVPPDGATDGRRNRQRWTSAGRPLVPWLEGAVIGASVALAIGFGWERLTGVRDGDPIASRGGVTVAAHQDTNTTAALHVAEQNGPAAPADPASSHDTAGPSVPQASAAPLDLAVAIEHLHRAERALYAGDAERALGILSDLDRHAGPALLREERLTTRVLALCQGGRVEDALDARRQLEREFASSIYMRRLDESCAVELERR